MKSSNQNIVLFVSFIILVYYIIQHTHTEHWQPYMQCPFKNWETAPDQPVFYPKIRYRVPYEWPYKFKSSYPVNHYRHFEQQY
jgi:hypothetical protein